MNIKSIIALIIFAMLTLCFPMISFAEDIADGELELQGVEEQADNVTDMQEETCDHEWNYCGLESIDNDYHGDVYQCKKCGEREVRDKQKHDLDYDYYSYTKCDDTYHYITAKCYDCGAELILKEEHDNDYYEEDWFDRIDGTYHYRYYGYCLICDNDVKVKEKHQYKATKTYSKLDKTYHYRTYKCTDCGGTKKVKQKHKYHNEYYGSKINGTYHKCYYGCDCGVEKAIKKKHTYSDQIDTTIRKATISKKAKIKRECDICSQYKYIYKKWSYSDSSLVKPHYSKSYWCKHSTVTKYSRTVKVTIDSGLKGAVVKLKIGKKVYKKKLKSNKKRTVKFKIKKPKFNQKVSIKVYYKKKLIGKDYNSTSIVTPGNKVRTGMTKAEVKYIWGSPDDTSSSSGGWSYWSYDDGSYVDFKNGKVKYWYDAAQ